MAKLEGGQNNASCESSGVHRIAGRLISLKQLPESLDGIHTLVGDKGAVLTPSVRDILRDKKINLVTAEAEKQAVTRQPNADRRVLSLVGSRLSPGKSWSVVELSSREDVIRELTQHDQECTPVVISAKPVEVSAHLAKWASTFFLPVCDEEAMTALEAYRPNGWVIHPSLCTAKNLERLTNAFTTR